jgi:hypothetical protein
LLLHQRLVRVAQPGAEPVDVALAARPLDEARMLRDGLQIRVARQRRTCGRWWGGSPTGSSER